MHAADDESIPMDMHGAGDLVHVGRGAVDVVAALDITLAAYRADAFDHGETLAVTCGEAARQIQQHGGQLACRETTALVVNGDDPLAANRRNLRPHPR